MHHALAIQEIVFNIFRHFRSDGAGSETADQDLAGLARTCRAFKEPALDVLWGILNCLSPVARCLPEASYQLSQGVYAFSRPLTQVEWDILRSYTRRVRRISIGRIQGLSQKSLITLSEPPTTESLFSNVLHLSFGFDYGKYLFLLLPFPSLVTLNIRLFHSSSFEDPLNSLARTSPSLTMLNITGDVYNPDIDPSFLHHWQTLRLVHCPIIPFNVVTLAHLSGISALSHLSLTLDSTFADEILSSDSLVFPKLYHLEMRSESLEPMSHLLFHARLPALVDILAFIDFCPSREEISTFFARIHTSCNPRAVQKLGLLHAPMEDRAWPILGFGDLQPCMTFSHLSSIIIDIEWKVELTDEELLTLASAWPHLEQLCINEKWGWNTGGGITPNGLLQLLQTCPMLTEIALAINTGGYTQTPPPLEWASPRISCLDVLDSFIEAESVSAIAAFLVGIASRTDFRFLAWDYCVGLESPHYNVCRARWKDVRRLVGESVTTRGR